MADVQPPFTLGQTVYVADASAHSQKIVPCPVCFGKLFVTLILGNGEQEKLGCDFCGRGGDSPSGTAKVWEPTSSVRSGTVTGLSQEYDGWIVMVNHGGHHRTKDNLVFADEASAEARRAVLFAEAQLHAEAMNVSNICGSKKKSGWTVGYHRAEIARLKRSLEWHEARLVRRAR